MHDSLPVDGGAGEKPPRNGKPRLLTMPPPALAALRRNTFIVSSDEARFLLVTEPAGFEDFMRACAEFAQRLEIPPPATDPPDILGLTKVAASYGIDIIGPPGMPA